MRLFVLSNKPKYTESCAFGVSHITPEQLQFPKTHLLFVTADSTCFVDIAAKIPVAYLPTVSKTVRIVPILPDNVFDPSVLEQLIHLYPDNAAALRRNFIYGEESFSTYVAGMQELYQWDKSIKTQLGGA